MNERSHRSHALTRPDRAPSTRQEAFCRHFVASGNAADAARQAGYDERDDGDPRDDDRIDDDRAGGTDWPDDAEFAPDHDIS